MQDYDISTFYRSCQALYHVSSDDGSPLKTFGYVSFVLTLGSRSLPVETLVLPHLGPDAMLIDTNVMKAFGAKLDWAAERLSLKDSNITIPEIHT